MKNFYKIQGAFLRIAFMLALVVLSFSLSAQITTPVANTEYFVTNVYSGKRLENSDGNYAVHRTANNTDRLNRQKFTFELVSGRYKIKNVQTGFYAYRSGSNGWDTNFQASTSDSWVLEASSGKTIIKWDGSNHWGVDTSGEGVYWSKSWSTSPNTRLQWEITFASYGKTALQTAITSATTTKNNAVVGTANGNYFQSDYDVLVAAIATAQGVYDNPTDQAQINSAVTTLNTAVSTFNSMAINKTTLQTAITSATTTKNAAVVGTTQGKYLQSDYDTFVAAISTAQGVYDSPTSQAQITTATSTLNTAATTFTAAMVKFVPTPGRYYTIKFKELDIALSKSSGGTSTQILTTNSSDVLQRIRFVADDTYPGSYWIYNGENQALDQVYANSWDLIWEVPSIASTYNGYRYYIETVNQTDIRIKSVKSGGYLGNSGGGDGSDVYADKNNTNYWKNIATDYFNITGTTNISGLELNASSLLTVAKGGDLTINTSATVNSITLLPGAKLTLNTGQALTTTGGVNLQSDVTGTATFVDTNNDSPQSVSGSVQQYLTAERNWYTASPVTNGTATILNKGTSVQTYTESTKAWSILSSEEALVAGKGYVSVATTGTGTSGNVSFVGTFNSGTIEVPVTRTAGAKEGFNLVANPYPSYLEWSLVTADALNSAIGKTIWFRTKTAANAYTFSTYNSFADESVANGASTTVTKYIPPMQAFWIRVNNGTASTNLTFKNSMRTHMDVSGNTMKAPKANDRVKMRLQLQNGLFSDETLIYFDSNASNSFDNYDSPKMLNNSAAMPDIYSLAGNERLVINGMGEMIEDMELPLGYSLKSADTLRIKVTQMNYFPNDKFVYLLDKEKNVEMQLLPESEYDFITTSETTNNDSRFSLLFRSPGSTTNVNALNELNVVVSVNSENQITINAPGKYNFSVFNAAGQKLIKNDVSTNHESVTCKLQCGFYVIKVLINGSEITRKVIIN